ncbi:hypothetical protein SAMN05428969_2803 [Devosia sp. YR412]|uniref:DUF1684 domain-containing protein n=1 Tax=Devosia sp. YR412 TaxID=1881030 RepID=UPI0008AC05F8|nr:DUF1684 domain-containing protein [Devosia sp. YR412]SEQ37371.1 hypothetical protein SAMN05428969_2803 [Devosia sp. YR412]
MAAPTDYLAQLDAWNVKRLADLKGPNGWLNIIGRFWLETGTVTFGSAADNDLVLSSGPAHAGSITQDDNGTVTFTPVNGVPQVLALAKYNPPRFTVENLLCEVTTLNGENALRIRDTASAAPAALTGIDAFPADPKWRIEAEWVSLETPKGMTVDTSKSIPTDVEATHKAVFAIDGQRYELFATHGTATSPQFVIRDLTSRDSTYPASRFVFGEDVTDTTITLDFNKAINPPCAFTEHAVCPLPPAENVLPIRIEAGEKRLPDSH